jgi:putative SOS response-associated peptidase YedK
VCNQYLRRRGFQDYAREFSQIRLPLVFPPPHLAPNLEPQDVVRPTDQAPIFRSRDDGVELAMARWWFLPWWHKGKLKDFALTTFNARSETIATSRTFRDSFARRRCVVPADAWYEFTGEKRDRVRWLVRPKDEEGICFAGIWDRCETTDAGTVESFTILMRDPEPPLDKLHNRQPVILRQQDWPTWLNLKADATPLFRLENGDRFAIERA